MKDPFAKFKALYLAGQDDEALHELASVEKEHSLPPNVLVIKGMCIELGSGTTPYTLDDAEAAYKKALEIDPDYVEALNEAGYYYLNMLDKRDTARPYFEKALSIACTQISEAIKGIAECISETAPGEALNFIKKAVKNAVDSQIIDKTVAEIKKLI
jgi:tetratricopeptide (TPR) repeat protein